MVMRGPRPERAIQPGQGATGVLTIANDGETPTRYAVEVSPGATLPLVGFAAEATSVFLTGMVQPGQSASVRVPITLPPDVAEGRKVVRVRVGRAGPAGELTELLDEEFFTGLLRVERPAPPTPPRPPEAERVPLPDEVGPPVAGRILRVEVSPRDLQAGQRGTVRVTYENTGRTPHAFSVVAWAGQFVGPQEIDPDVQGAVRGPTVQPRTQSTLAISLDFPQDPPFGLGGKDVLVLLVDLDPTGRFPVATYAPSTLRRAFNLRALPALPEPPRNLAPGDLELGDPVATPAAVSPGQAVEFRVPFFNVGPVAPPVDADVFVLGPAGTAVATLPRLRFTPQRSVETARTVRWTVPPNAQEGSYGLRVFAWDPNTFVPGNPTTYLVREDVLDLFRVQAPVVPERAPELPAPAAPPVPEVRAPRLGDLATPTVSFSPRSVEAGQVARGSVTVPSRVDFPISGVARLTLEDAQGRFVDTLLTDAALQVLGRGAGEIAVEVDTADLMPGSYGLRLSMREAATGALLLTQALPGAFSVTVPTTLRGVNEFRVIRCFYNGVPQPVDLRLLRIGPPQPLPITKRAGEPTGGSVLLEHRGEGGEFSMGYGIARGRAIPRLYNQPFRFFVARSEMVPPHPVPTLVWVFIPESAWPTTAIAPSGRYDALKFIDDARTRRTVWQEWDDDVFEVPR